ncbi:MAG: response regulator [Kofleriaceae bacterium]|nr:response regulator [Kofleriaceae bacterium]MBP6838357.1 response regulator [Kofleriaceae bacterium]
MPTAVEVEHATEIEARLGRVALERTRAGSLILIVAITISLIVSGPAGVTPPAGMYALNAAMCALAGVLYVVTSRGRFPLRHIHLALSLLGLGGPIITIATEYVTGEASLVAPLLIATLAISFAVSTTWCVATLGALLALWLPVRLSLPGPVDGMAVASVLGTALMSLVFHVVNRRYVVVAEQSRLVAEAAAARLRTELDERLRAEADREQLRDQFVHAQRMEAVGTLAAGLAHDMNNILGGILGISELILENARDPALRSDLGDICREAARGAALTHSLLAFSRRGQYRREVVALDQITDQIVPLLRRTLPKSVELARIGGCAVSIDGDPAQLGQVVINLCLNGADAMTSGGRLLIGTSAIFVGPDHAERLGVRSGAYGVIEVTDTGGGMDEATRARIFEPFFTTKPVGKGTGLGLAMVFGAVQSHGGAIEVESALGAGTTFRIFLPQARATGSVVAPAAELDSAPIRQRGLVLLVDDEPLIRQATTRLLERFGLTVLTATDGAEAVRLFEARAADIALVILDMAMPVMSGAECFVRLRALRPVPILLASGYAVEAEARALLAAGAAGFLDKPYSASQLGQQVTRILGPLDQVGATASAG